MFGSHTRSRALTRDSNSTASKSCNTSKTTGDTEFVLGHTELDESNREILSPTEASLAEEDERKHHALPLGSPKSQQGTENNHHGNAAGEGPLPVANLASEHGQEEGTEANTKVLGQGQDNAISEVGIGVCEENRNHCRVDDVDRVIKHGYDEAHYKRSGEFTALIPGEDMGRREWLLQWGECLPATKSDEKNEAADECADDLGVVRWKRGSVDDADEDERNGDNEEEGSHVVELLECLLEW